jgi:hypothetical protein
MDDKFAPKKSFPSLGDMLNIFGLSMNSKTHFQFGCSGIAVKEPIFFQHEFSKLSMAFISGKCFTLIIEE